MLVESVAWVVRLKARPPRTPFSEKRSRRLRDAAVFASGSFLQSLRSHGVHSLPLRLFSHPRRADRSIRGSSLRLPEARGALNPEARRRCTWFRQFRDAVDTVPSFPEPSRTLYSYNRNMSRGQINYFAVVIEIVVSSQPDCCISTAQMHSIVDSLIMCAKYGCASRFHSPDSCCR